jgi:hypothetical protein
MDYRKSYILWEQMLFLRIICSELELAIYRV